MKILISLTFVFVSVVNLFSQTKKVLFIGNSYTSVNNLPSLISQLATSKGESLLYDSNTPGGHQLVNHAVNATTLSKISSDDWDFVVIQGQSQEAGFPDGQLVTDVYPYAEILVDSIISNNSCTMPLFYMTWGRENGDQTNCGSYPPYCTYNGMQSRLRSGYLNMATMNMASVSPVGVAWKYVRDNYPAIDLYNADESHPSIYGSYLAACVFYVAIYKESILGSSFISSLSASDAAILQDVASNIVLDSLGQWKIGAYDAEADFSFAGTGTTVDFTNTSNNSVDYYWDFGDGTNSIDPNPTHNYASSSIYNVMLVSVNECTFDTTFQDVDISSLEVGDLEKQFQIKILPHQIEITGNVDFTTYHVYTFNGKTLLTGDVKEGVINVSGLKKGLFILRIQGKGNFVTRKFVR